MDEQYPIDAYEMEQEQHRGFDSMTDDQIEALYAENWEEIENHGRAAQATTPEQKQKSVWITLHEKFVDENLVGKSDPEAKPFNVVRIPYGIEVDGQDIGGYEFHPLYVNPSKYKGEHFRDIPLLPDREIWLHKDKLDDGRPIIDQSTGKKAKDVIKVMPQALKEAVRPTRITVHRAFVREGIEGRGGKTFCSIRIPPKVVHEGKELGNYQFIVPAVKTVGKTGDYRSVSTYAGRAFTLERAIRDEAGEMVRDGAGVVQKTRLRLKAGDINQAITAEQDAYRQANNPTQTRNTPAKPKDWQQKREHTQNAAKSQPARPNPNMGSNARNAR